MSKEEWEVALEEEQVWNEHIKEAEVREGKRKNRGEGRRYGRQKRGGL